MAELISSGSDKMYHKASYLLSDPLQIVANLCKETDPKALKTSLDSAMVPLSLIILAPLSCIQKEFLKYFV
jgi:hypothetical protein